MQSHLENLDRKLDDFKSEVNKLYFFMGLVSPEERQIKEKIEEIRTIINQLGIGYCTSFNVIGDTSKRE